MLIEAALLPRNLSSHVLWFHFITVPFRQGKKLRFRFRYIGCTEVYFISESASNVSNIQVNKFSFSW
jgi:hypothetical protein